MPDIIQSLWVGTRLSALERLSIASFLQNGHPFHLYGYGPIEGVPHGAVMLDANEILPSARIFKYTGFDSYAGFANFFRYKLLLDKGGWWVDLDTVCLRPFEFAQPFVFSSEMNESAPNVFDVPAINSGVLKAPRGSAIFRTAWDACRQMDPSKLAWGEAGPTLLQRLVREFSMQKYVQPPAAFCPFAYPEWHRQLKPEESWEFGEETYAVHLWNELWRRAGADKDRTWDADCLFERLKQRYLGAHAIA